MLFVSMMVVCWMLHWEVHSKQRRFPPGPLRLPLIGNLWYFLSKRKSLVLAMATERDYKDLMSIYSTNHTVLLLSSEVIHEVFVKQGEKVSIRPPDGYNPIHQLSNGAFLTQPHGTWQPLRRLLLNVFRDFGIGRTGEVEEKVTTEVEFFLNELQDTNGNSFDVRALLSNAAANSITTIVFGERIDYCHEQLRNIETLISYISKGVKTRMVPLIQYLPGDPFGLQAAKLKAKSSIDFACRRIEEHRKTLDKSHSRDYIDRFLIEMDENQATRQVFTDSNLLAAVLTIYLAGTDTTSASLYWAYLYLIVFPEYQEKIYQEIQVTAGDREICFEDRYKMNCTEAFINEVLRMCTVPISLLHVATEDIHVKGYVIPKDAVVIASLWGTCGDEKNFPDANRFYPERFLNDQGQFEKPDGKNFIPFSAGRRSCPGERLARMEMFLFITNTIRHFRLEKDQKQALSLKGHQPFVYEPKPYRMKFIPRL